MALCPECGQKLRLRKDLQRWDHIYCESCHAELEVLHPTPLKLEAIFESEDEELVRDLNDDLKDDGDVVADDIDWDDNEGGDEHKDEDDDEW